FTFLARHAPTRTSPLFPYTTLFRSIKVPGDSHVALRARDVALLIYRPGGPARVTHFHFPKDLGRFPQRRSRANGAAGSDRDLSGDRKSTRLNSSHQIISYAVFCLKK